MSFKKGVRYSGGDDESRFSTNWIIPIVYTVIKKEKSYFLRITAGPVSKEEVVEGDDLLRGDGKETERHGG